MWWLPYLCCVLIVGYSVARRLARGRSWIECAGWSLCLGPGVLGLCLIGLSLLGQQPTRIAVVAVTLLWAVVGIFVKRPPPPMADAPAGGERAPWWWAGLCLAGIGYGIFVVAFDALVYPASEWDAFATWQLKSKVLAGESLRPRPAYFSDIALSFSHLRYPILVPMISAGEHAMAGRIDDEREKAPFLLMYLGLGAVVYAAVRSRRGTMAALPATALLMTTPLMLLYGGAGTAELALTAFYGCSIICLLRWQQQQRTEDFMLVTLLGICLAWTKNEGYVLAAINAAVMVALTPQPLRPRHLALTLGSALIVAAGTLPWILYAHGLPHTDENYSDRLSVRLMMANLPRVPLVARKMLAESVWWRDWGIFWFVLAGAAISQWRRFTQRPVLTLWVLLAAQLLAYLPPFLVVNVWNVNELLYVTTGRLLLHATPAAALLIGLQWPGPRRD
ncbi:MAG: glycosyltransferase family 39 protein [Tepidisphaeraceae bacterium]|jgi:hypothetical protein